MPAIEFEDVHFTYDGARFVLRGVDLAVERGEFLCVLGGNGSGKSTLAQHIDALLVPDRGAVRVLGRDTADADAVFFVRSHAGMVFQNPDDQIVATLVENDVAFGPENLGVAAAELQERVSKALAQVGLAGFERAETAALSGGQKQRVAIAGVLAMEPEVLVLDEASAMLDPRGRAGLLRVCHELNDAGLTIVMITHSMEEAAHADRVIVLDDGEIVMEGAPEQVLVQAERLAALSLDVPFAVRMSLLLRERGLDVGVHVDEDALEASVAAALEGCSAGEDAPADAAPPCPDPDGTVLVSFENVSYTYHSAAMRKRRGKREAAARTADWGNAPDELWALRDVSFELHEGEFLGVAGHTGSGKSTLIQHMNGLLAPTRGRVLVGGEPIGGAAEAARAGVGIVFQYPEHQLFAATVFEDVAFGPRNLGAGDDEVEAAYAHAMDLVGLDAAALRDASPFELSGGQQRRVAFAGVLAMAPRTLILDEPVAGLDPRSREDFLGLIARLHRHEGHTVVMVSHNMDDLARFCTRVLLLDQGRVAACGHPADVLRDDAALKRIGLGAPATVRLAGRLAAAGVALPAGLLGEAALADALCARAGKALA